MALGHFHLIGAMLYALAVVTGLAAFARSFTLIAVTAIFVFFGTVFLHVAPG